MEDCVNRYLAMHIESSMALADELSQAILQAGIKLADAILNDGKVLVCAQGLSYPNGLHFVHFLLGAERPPLPVMMLGNYVSLFEMANPENKEERGCLREIQALAHQTDVLFILSINGGEPTLMQVIHAAKEREIAIVLVSGDGTNTLKNLLDDNDLCLVLPTQTLTQILELQLVTLHGIGEVIEHTIFKQIME